MHNVILRISCFLDTVNKQTWEAVAHSGATHVGLWVLTAYGGVIKDFFHPILDGWGQICPRSYIFSFLCVFNENLYPKRADFLYNAFSMRFMKKN